MSGELKIIKALTAERDELKKELAIKDRALELACAVVAEDECGVNVAEQGCPHGLTCNYRKGEYGKCWLDHFIHQAKEQI